MQRNPLRRMAVLLGMLLLLTPSWSSADDGGPDAQDDDETPTPPSEDDEAPDEEEGEPEASSASEDDRRPSPSADRTLRRDLGDRTEAARGRTGNRRRGPTVRPDAPLPPRAPPPLPDFML